MYGRSLLTQLYDYPKYGAPFKAGGERTRSTPALALLAVQPHGAETQKRVPCTFNPHSSTLCLLTCSTRFPLTAPRHNRSLSF